MVEAGQVWRSISIPAFVPDSACHLISPCLSSPSAIGSTNTVLFSLPPQTDWGRNSSACPVAPLGIIKRIINNNRNIYCCMSTADLLATCAHKVSIEPREITHSVTSSGCSAPTICQITLTSHQIMAKYCKEM